ncbi:MAG: DUF5106 domain-containing protein, partial [Bacteroidales bacterium]|nr:DUF5106 domain-containing protein [Bacteroidales bacterium]
VLKFFVMGCGTMKEEQFQALPFPDVLPPEMIQNPQDRAEYLAEHYWDGLTDPYVNHPSDSVLVNGVRKSDVEQKFADWTSVLNIISFQKAGKAINRLYDRALSCERKDSTSNVFETFTELFSKYLYDPNSPVRNEDHYNVFVARLADYDGLSPEMKGKYEFEARMTSINRTGEVAADFRFADKYGRMHTLHGIKAPRTLLFFSNPGCEACMNIINVLKGEPAIAQMISSGSLAVVNIYIDEDIQGWRDYMPIYPEDWYNGFDPDLVIRNDNLYYVRAIPSLYLLDEEKRVILKDAPENRLFEFLLSR